MGQAQTAVSLIEVEGGGTRIGFEGERALGFRTAASAGTGFDGWLVTEVELRIRPDDATGTIRTATPPGLALCEATGSGDPHPNGTCFPLTAPATVQIPTGMTTGQEVTYTATGSGHFLATDTEYTLHFTENNSTHAGRVHHLDASTNDGEAVHVAGAFANVMRQLNADGTWGGSSSSVAWTRITGYPGGARTNAGYSGALVSNIVQTSGGTTNLAVNDAFQDFTTGENDDGYTLDGIEITLQGAGAGTPPTVTLHSVSATGPKVADFTGPPSLVIGSTSNYTYVPTTTVTLSKSTIYFVIVQDGDGLWPYTTSDYEEFAAPGWSIGNASLARPEDTTSIFYLPVGGAGLLRVKGTVNQPPPGSLVARSLVSNVGQTDAGQDAISETNDLAQSFTTGTNRAGYVLNSVDIRFVSTASGVSSDPPTVTLHTGSATGTAVAVLSRTGAIMAKDNYEFAAASPVPLTHSTAYWVVAEGGGAGLAWVKTSSTSEDAGGAGGWMIADRGEFRTANSNGVFSQFSAGVGLSLRVNGLSNPSPATGAGSINAPNAFRVPAKLFVTFAGVVDLNGVTNIAASATYTWQRFAANGTTLETDNIGTGDTYTLTDQDAGRKLRVVVSFFDDDGYPEGPLNSVPTPVINAAATCAAPTLTGGATQLGPARKVTVESYGMSPDLKYGFSAAAGMLDNATFTTTAPNNYDIESIHTTDSSLEVELNTALTANEKRTVALHVCDQAYAFKSGTLSGSTYTFTSPSQDWSGHAERLVYLSQDTTVPTFVEARVNGTSLVMTFSEDLGAAASLANGAFTVKKGSGGTTQTLSGSPSISGSTVTLTLATTVTATDTDVKVAYTKPTTGTANKLVDKFDNEVATFPDQNVINALADSVPPVLAATDAAVLAADGLTLTLTYNEALKESAVPDNSVFTVKATPAGGSEAEVALASSDGVTVSGSTVVLKLAVPIAHNDGSVKVTYAKPATGAVIEDANGNDAADFDRAVTNNSTVPRVSIERLYADASPGIADPAFRVRRSNSGGALTVNIGITQAVAYLATTQTITIPAGNLAATAWFTSDYMGNTSGDLTATVSGGNDHLPAVAPDNSATVRMKVPASGPTVWVSHEHLSLTVNEDGGTADMGVVFSTGAGVAKPRVGEITVAAFTDQGTASINRDYRHLSKYLPVGAGDWRAVAGGSYSHTEPFSITILDDDQYEPTDETFIVWLDSAPGVTFVLDIPGRIDPDGSATVTIVDNTPDTLKVSSVEVTSTPTAGYYGATDTIEFTVTFTGNVTVTGAPQFAFDLGGTTRQVAYASGSGSQELVFSHTVVATDGDDHDGISWAANALSLNGGTIKFTHTDVAEQVDAGLDHAAQAALPGHKVEAAKPRFVEASVNGTALTVTFSEDLDTTAAPANSAFTVKKGSGGTAQTLSSTAPSISGATVTLTLATASAVTATDTDVKVAYTKPSANPLKDLVGKEMDTFADQDVTNQLADQVPPQLAATDAAVLAADGLTLTLTYNEALKESSVPDNSVFTVEATPAGSSEAAVALASSGGVTVSGSTVVLKLAVPITHNDSSVKVTYAKPTTGAVIEDANGNDAADFTDRAVTNNSTVPRVSIEAVHADASSLIANPVFRIRRSNMGAAHLNVEVSVSQTGAFTHLTDITDFISSGQTEKEYTLDMDYAGNTSGDLTFTVAEGAGYVPALAPDGAATVQVKAPASGLPLSVRHDQASWTVDEGATVAPTVTFTLAPGLADPRDHFDAYLETVGEVAKGGDDFVSNPYPIAAAEPGDWQPASGGGKTHTAAITYVTLQDTVVEPNEVFYLRFDSRDSRDSLDIPTTLPDRRTTISILDDDALEVTDVEVTSTPTGGYYSVGDTIEFTVTFSAPVKTASGPQFAFELAGQARQAAYTGTDDMAEQTFEYTVANTDADDHDGISWGANALGLNGGSITIPSDKALIPRNADLAHAAQGALPGHKVDTTKPRLEEAEVDGVTLSMFFSEELNTTAPANSAFDGEGGRRHGGQPNGRVDLGQRGDVDPRHCGHPGADGHGELHESCQQQDQGPERQGCGLLHRPHRGPGLRHRQPPRHAREPGREAGVGQPRRQHDPALPVPLHEHVRQHVEA